MGFVNGSLTIPNHLQHIENNIRNGKLHMNNNSDILGDKIISKSLILNGAEYSIPFYQLIDDSHARHMLSNNDNSTLLFTTDAEQRDFIVHKYENGEYSNFRFDDFELDEHPEDFNEFIPESFTIYGKDGDFDGGRRKRRNKRTHKKRHNKRTHKKRHNKRTRRN